MPVEQRETALPAPPLILQRTRMGQALVRQAEARCALPLDFELDGDERGRSIGRRRPTYTR